MPVGAGHDALADVLYVVTSDLATNRLERLRDEEGSFTVVVPSLEDFLTPTAGHPLAVGPAVAPDGSVALGDGVEEYRIVILGPTGRRLRQLRRDVKPTRKPEEELEAELQAARRRIGMTGGAEGRKVIVSGSQLGLISEFRTFFDRTNGLEYDDHGRLWVRTNRGETGETVFDLFDASGAYLGEIVAPKTIGAFDVAHGLLAGSTSGELDVPTVTVWRVPMDSPDP
jgi:hypothetical protein